MKKHILYSILVLTISSMSSSVEATVTVTWAADATANIQAAIDSGDPDIIIPNVGAEWIARPLFLNRSNQQITFAPGVLVKAKPGAFPNVGDCLFAAVNKTNITLSGYGATLQMVKSEYTTGEWRHTISFKTCSNINVLGLTALDSGGDGVFIADSYVSPFCCTNVLVKDCIFNNHRRLGAAVISGKNVTFENCVFSNSIGTAPQAGVDLEPDQTNQRLENIDFYNCFAVGNYGGGYLIATSRFNATSAPVDVELHRCYAEYQGPDSYPLFLLPATVATGSYRTTDCTFTSDAKACLRAERNFSNAVAFLATRCRFESKNQNPLRIFDSAAPQCGNLTFTDCVAHYQGTNPYISWEIFDGVNSGIANISGNIDVYNPNGARVNWGSIFSNITLATTPHNTRVPAVAITSPAMGATLTAGDMLNFTATASDPDTGTADGLGMSQVVFEVWRSDNAINTLTASVPDTSAAYSASIGTSGWAPGNYMLVARGLSLDGSEKRRISYVRVVTGGSTLQARWTFDEGTGTSSADVTGNGNLATLFNGVAWGTGKSGSAVVTDGIDDWIKVNYNPNLFFGATDKWSLSLWLKTPGSTSVQWVYYTNASSLNQFISVTVEATGKVNFGARDAALKRHYTFGSTAIADNLWHHVVVVRDGSLIGTAGAQKIYIDGALQTTTQIVDAGQSGNFYTSTAELRIGRATNAGTSYFKGTIDQYRIYRAALTASDVLSLFNAGQ